MKFNFWIANFTTDTPTLFKTNTEKQLSPFFTQPKAVDNQNILNDFYV